MAISQKTVNYCVEVDTILGVVVTAITDVKSGKSPLAIVGDLLPMLVSSISGIGQIGPEVADKADLEMTVGVKLAEIVKALTA
jgi:hypothetical protein